MRRRWLKIGLAVAIVILILVGVRVLVAPAIIAHPDSVHIVITENVDAPTPNKTLIFDHQFSQQATTIYMQMVLSGALQGPASCPSHAARDPYYEYVLTFSHWGVTTATATSDAIACMYLLVEYPLGSYAVYPWQDSGGISFWAWLHHAVNAPLPIGPCMSDPQCHG